MSKSVAVIGAGVMGAPIAERVSAWGYDLTVCDVNEHTLATFSSRGIATTPSPAECATADVLLIVVADLAQSQDVLTGPTGVLSALPANHHPVIVVMGTISKDAVIGLAADVRAAGGRFLDAPISGGPLRAAAGTLAVMVGGEAEDLDAARPVLECVGNNIFHCGPVGAGQSVKIINNLVGAINVVVVGEAYRIALESGLSLEDVTPVLEASSGRVNLSRDAAEARESYALWCGDDGSYDNVKMIMQKDMLLARDMAAGTSGTYPALAQILQIVNGLDEVTQANWRAVGDAAPGQQA